MENEEIKSDNSKESLLDKLKKKRKEINEDINMNVASLKDIKNITNIQINILSLRQRLIEENHELYEIFNSLQKKYREVKGKELQKLGEGQFQYRFQHNEKNSIIESNHSDLKYNMDIFENQINFYEGTIKTVDSILFGLKMRLEIENTFGAIPFK